VLRIGHGVSENHALRRLLAALGRIRSCKDLGRKRFSAQWGKCAPRVKLAAGPVSVGWANIPTTEHGVGFAYVRPQGKQGSRCLGELTVTDVTLVEERVVLGNDLVRTEVGRLEVS
jgi:hypothetical protein